MIGHNYRTPSTKWQTLLLAVFAIRIPKTKHEIMLHAVSLNSPTLLNCCLVPLLRILKTLDEHIIRISALLIQQSGSSTISVFKCILKQKADTLKKLSQYFRMLLLLITA